MRALTFTPARGKIAQIDAVADRLHEIAMKKLLLLLLLLALPAQPSAQAPRPLVFTHVTVLDMTGAPSNPDRTVVITGDRITDLGKSGAVQVPEGAQVVDATGKFMIPGLWDMHVHWLHKDYLPVEKGKIADLVVLAANPLEDIGNSRKIDAVVLGGKLLAKAELQKTLADLEPMSGKK